MNIAQTAEFLQNNDNYIIITHEGSDPDGLAAQYALYHLLSSYNKNVKAINSEASPMYTKFIDPEGVIKSLQNVSIDDEEIRNSCIIIVDTNDIHYTGDIEDRIITKAKSLFIIDHHENKNIDESKNCLLSQYSSASEIVFYIYQSLKKELSKNIAFALLAGIVFDTGSFAYDKTQESTFFAALELVKKGAIPSEVHSALYQSSEVNVLLLRKEVLSTLELTLDNKVAIQYLTPEILNKTNSKVNDAEGLINVPLQASSVVVSILFKLNKDSPIRCSLRSKGDINVSRIAQIFGGGGHKKAAGFKTFDSLEIIREKVIKLVMNSIGN